MGIFRTVALAGFFFAGYRFPAGEFFPRFFCIAPQADLVQVSLVVHEYQSQNKGIRTAKGRGECMQLKNPGMDSSQEFGMTGWGSLRADRVVGCWNDRG